MNIIGRVTVIIVIDDIVIIFCLNSITLFYFILLHLLFQLNNGFRPPG